MNFLLLCSEGAGRDLPWMGSSVAATAASAASAMLEGCPSDAVALFVGRTPPAFELPAGFAAATPQQASRRLEALPPESPGIALAAGVIEPPRERLAALVEEASPGQPAPLLNQAGHRIAVAWTVGDCAAALGPGFDETVSGVEIPRRVARVLGVARVRDAGSWSDALRAARRQTARRLLAAGVLLEDPDTLWADPTVEVEPGARIGPSVVLLGTTRIAAGAEVAAFCRLENTEVGRGARILSHTTISDSDIQREAKVGPFTHVRPNTRLEPGAFAGAFTETKNATLGRNSALPHLSYLGDCDVAHRVNLGAGTVTCNYDGRGKHRTIVEAGAFVGSNAILVAPVRIGRKAFVAAGSVIVEDVPDGALAIARGRQAVKPGRAAGRFEGADEV